MKGIIKIIVVLIFIVIVGFVLFYRSYSIEEDGSLTVSGLLVSERIREYPLYAMVTEPSQRLGVALEEYELDFGYVPVHSNVTKYVSIYNQGSPSKIHLSAEGNISRFMEFDENDFIVEEEKEVSVTLAASEKGNFSGALMVSAVKPRSGWLNWMFPLI